MEVPIDVDQPSSWKRYKPEMCATCAGYCCTMPVEVKFSDLVRLEIVDPLENPKQAAVRLKKERIVKSFRASTGLYQLEQKSDRSCIFLDKNRKCTVYEKRPDVCRSFPSVGPRPGYCPYGALKI